MAALTLPGLLAPAHAETAPEHNLLAYKWLHYQDSQPGLERVHVNAPSLYLEVPLGEQWSVDGSAVLDSVSGASPRYYTAVSGASKMHDMRSAGDVHITHFRPRSSYSVSFSNSNEHDYLSSAVSLAARFSTDDNNTTFNIGAGGSYDTINPVNDIVTDAHKRTQQYIAGLTHDLTPQDLVQLQLGYSLGKGYFSDPYKTADDRPAARNQGTGVLRWNHHFDGLNGSMRTRYRYYFDSWKVHAHTLGLEWAQPAGEALTLTPALTYFTQSSAEFYIDPPAGGGLPAIPAGQHSSLDQRLSAFGAGSISVKLEARLSSAWSADLKGEYYQQRAQWRLLSAGSPGLEPFSYYAIQIGLSCAF